MITQIFCNRAESVNSNPRLARSSRHRCAAIVNPPLFVFAVHNAPLLAVRNHSLRGACLLVAMQETARDHKHIQPSDNSARLSKICVIPVNNRTFFGIALP
jgi:hypothetical protein